MVADVAADLRADLAGALYPGQLMRAAGMEPDPWQADLLRSDAQRVLLLCTRQAGKSTVTACLALHTAIYEPGSLTLMLAPSLRQSGELFRRVKEFLSALPVPPAIDQETALQLTLGNGSRIVSLPGKESTVRGYSRVRLLAVDEAARVPDELYYALRPMLAVSQGRLIGLTTPFGQRGWFHAEWEKGTEPWKRVRVPATLCPRISAEFLEAERQALGWWWWKQEYGCEFVDALDQVFLTEHVMGALDPGLEPLFGGAL